MQCTVCNKEARIHVTFGTNPHDDRTLYMGDSFCSRKCLRRGTKKGGYLHQVIKQGAADG